MGRFVHVEGAMSTSHSMETAGKGGPKDLDNLPKQEQRC